MADLTPPVAFWPAVRTSDPESFASGAAAVVVGLVELPGASCVWRFEAIGAKGWMELEEPCVDFRSAPWRIGDEVWVSARTDGRSVRAEVLGLGRAGSATLERPLLYFAGADPSLPLEIRTNLTVEYGAAAEQRVATEVLTRSDGCTFVWNHGALGFATADATVWVRAGEDQAVGAHLRARTFAAVRALGAPAPGCAGDGSVRFRLLANPL